MPESGGPPGEGNGNHLQYSCLGNLMDKGAWQNTAELDTTEATQHTHTHKHIHTHTYTYISMLYI